MKSTIAAEHEFAEWDDMLTNVVRLLNTLANLLVFLASLTGVPQAGGYDPPVSVWNVCSGRCSVSPESFGARHLPVRAAEPRDLARTGIATAGRSIPSQPGVLPDEVTVPPPNLSGNCVRPSGARSAFVLYSSSFVRGPPLAI